MSTFISYSRENSDFVLKLIQDLKKAGCDVWLDQLNIPTGSRWDDEIEKALHSCDTFLLVLSPDSIKSQNVKDELGYAVDSGKRILPVMYMKCEIPFRIRRFQFVNFIDKSYKDALEDLKNQILNTDPTQSAADIADIAKEQPKEKMQPVTEKKVNATPAAEKKEPSPVLVNKPAVEPAQKKGLPMGLIIGIGALVLLSICAIIGFSVLGAGGATADTTQPAAAISVGSSDDNATAPLILSPSDAAKLGKMDVIASLALEQNSEDELKTLSEIPVTLSKSKPVFISDNWCAATEAILDENLKYMEFSFQFNGENVPENDITFARSSYEENGVTWYCHANGFVVDKWNSGQYSASTFFTLTAVINDGESDMQPYSSQTNYVITVP